MEEKRWKRSVEDDCWAAEVLLMVVNWVILVVARTL
jgi:hypothetical protein